MLSILPMSKCMSAQKMKFNDDSVGSAEKPLEASIFLADMINGYEIR